MLTAILIVLGVFATADGVRATLRRTRATRNAEPAPIVEHVDVGDDPIADTAFLAQLADSFRPDAATLAPRALGPITEDDWYAASFDEIGRYLDSFLDRRLPVALPANLYAALRAAEDAIASDVDRMWHLVDAMLVPTGEYAVIPSFKRLIR